MGIYIPGMELPDKDHLVLVEIDSNGDIFAAYDGGRTKLTQHKAVPVPPHGKLGDLDELVAAYDAEHVGPPGRARELIIAAPIIIPADREK